MTAVVVLRNPSFAKSFVPIITLARPVTMVPVPTLISKKPCCWQNTQPARAASPLARASPMIFTVPLSLARAVTRVSLSPAARRSRPERVFRYRSKRSFTISTITNRMTATVMSKVRLDRAEVISFSKMVS